MIPRPSPRTPTPPAPIPRAGSDAARSGTFGQLERPALAGPSYDEGRRGGARSLLHLMKPLDDALADVSEALPVHRCVCVVPLHAPQGVMEPFRCAQKSFPEFPE